MIGSKIGRILGLHVDPNQLGQINGAEGCYQIFPDHPNPVRIPDVSFTRRERLDPLGPTDGHCRIVPDMVIEVVSPREPAQRLESKIQDFLSVGVPLNWVVSPVPKIVRVYGPAVLVKDFRVGDILDGGEVVPGFKCEVSRIFE